MAHRQHHPAPTVGIVGKWKRNGKQVTVVKGKDVLVLLDAKSLRKAKRYFRTGKEAR